MSVAVFSIPVSWLIVFEFHRTRPPGTIPVITPVSWLIVFEFQYTRPGTIPVITPVSWLIVFEFQYTRPGTIPVITPVSWLIVFEFHRTRPGTIPVITPVSWWKICANLLNVTVPTNLTLLPHNYNTTLTNSATHLYSVLFICAFYYGIPITFILL